MRNYQRFITQRNPTDMFDHIIDYADKKTDSFCVIEALGAKPPECRRSEVGCKECFRAWEIRREEE